MHFVYKSDKLEFRVCYVPFGMFGPSPLTPGYTGSWLYHKGWARNFPSKLWSFITSGTIRIAGLNFDWSLPCVLAKRRAYFDQLYEKEFPVPPVPSET